MEQSASEHIATWTLEPGDEVVESIKRAAQGVGRAISIIGAGEIEDAEILVLGPVVTGATAGRTHRKLRGPADLISVIGHVDGAQVELRAMIAREGEAGPSVVGGLLVRATAVSVRLAVSGAGVVERPRTQGADHAPSPRAAVPEVESAVSPAPPPAVSFGGSSAMSGSSMGSSMGASPPMPPKLGRATEQPDAYPEENDVVTHFHFGRCVVLVSDGERLRLQQERDGRVREVALSMLRIQAPTILEDGRKHWDLARKN